MFYYSLLITYSYVLLSGLSYKTNTHFINNYSKETGIPVSICWLSVVNQALVASLFLLGFLLHLVGLETNLIIWGSILILPNAAVGAIVAVLQKQIPYFNLQVLMFVLPFYFMNAKN